MSARQEHLDSRAIALLLACSLFWGFQQVMVKATLPEVPPVLQAAIRFTGATVLLWLWCRWRNVGLFERDGSLPAGLLAGGLFAAEFACLYIGMQSMPASRLTILLYTAPFWVALLLPLFVASERLRAAQWAGLAAAFAAVVFALRDNLSGQAGQGELLALLAGLFWGLTTVAIRASALARVAPEKMLFYQVAVGMVVLPMLSLWLGEVWAVPDTPFAVLSLLLQTVVGAFASFLVWMWLLRNYPATKISSFVFLTPLFTLLFGALWLGEAVTPRLLMALVLVAAGIVLVNRRPG